MATHATLDEVFGHIHFNFVPCPEVWNMKRNIEIGIRTLL